MDRELYARWKANEPPFDSDMVLATGYSSISDTRMALKALFDLLISPQQQELREVEDWHEHDGVILPYRLLPVDELRVMLGDDDRLLARCSDDTMVCLGIYDPDMRYYVRVHVCRDGIALGERLDPDPDALPLATIDVSCDRSLVRSVASAMKANLSCAIQTTNTTHYFATHNRA